MLGIFYENEICSAARSLELIGERWSLLILRDALFRGYTRFCDFQNSLNIAPNILTKRLAGFVESGIMETKSSRPGSKHYDYVLTEKGQELKPIIIALTNWGDRWNAPHGAPISFEHQDCGGRVEQQLYCEACNTVPETKKIIARETEAMAIYKEKGSK